MWPLCVREKRISVGRREWCWEVVLCCYFLAYLDKKKQRFLKICGRRGSRICGIVPSFFWASISSELRDWSFLFYFFCFCVFCIFLLCCLFIVGFASASSVFFFSLVDYLPAALYIFSIINELLFPIQKKVKDLISQLNTKPLL